MVPRVGDERTARGTEGKLGLQGVDRPQELDRRLAVVVRGIEVVDGKGHVQPGGRHPLDHHRRAVERWEHHARFQGTRRAGIKRSRQGRDGLGDCRCAQICAQQSCRRSTGRLF